MREDLVNEAVENFLLLFSYISWSVEKEMCTFTF